MNEQNSKEYPIRVIVRTGKAWRAWPSVDKPSEGEVAWRARRVPPSAIVEDIEHVMERLNGIWHGYEPGERQTANWDDDLLVQRTNQRDCATYLAAQQLLGKAFDAWWESEVLELAPGLDPETGRRGR